MPSHVDDGLLAPAPFGADVAAAAAMGDAGIPLSESHLKVRNGDRRDGNVVRRIFVLVVIDIRRAHFERPALNHDHFRTVGTFLKSLKRRKRALVIGRQDSHMSEPIQRILQRALKFPNDQTHNQKHRKSAGQSLCYLALAIAHPRSQFFPVLRRLIAAARLKISNSVLAEALAEVFARCRVSAPINRSPR